MAISISTSGGSYGEHYTGKLARKAHENVFGSTVRAKRIFKWFNVSVLLDFQMGPSNMYQEL